MTSSKVAQSVPLGGLILSLGLVVAALAGFRPDWNGPLAGLMLVASLIAARRAEKSIGIDADRGRVRVAAWAVVGQLATTTALIFL